MNLARWTVLPLFLAALVGCKSTHEDKDYYKEIVSDLDSIETGLKDGGYKIDTVTKSLDKLSTAQGDLRGPLGDLDRAIAGMDGTSDRIQSLGKDLDAKQAKFESNWKDEIEAIESSSVRKTAETGRAAVDASFKSLDQRSASVANTFREWESKVKSIQSSLQKDLSPANLQSLGTRIKEVTSSAPALKESIRMLTNDIGALSSSMRSIP